MQNDERPVRSDSDYRGAGDLTINDLLEFYHGLTKGADGMWMEGLHPLKTFLHR